MQVDCSPSGLPNHCGVGVSLVVPRRLRAYGRTKYVESTSPIMPEAIENIDADVISNCYVTCKEFPPFMYERYFSLLIHFDCLILISN